MDDGLLKGQMKVGFLIIVVGLLEILNSIWYINKLYLDKWNLSTDNTIYLVIVVIGLILTISVCVFFYRGYERAKWAMVAWITMSLIIWVKGFQIEEVQILAEDDEGIRTMYILITIAYIGIIPQIIFSKYIKKFMYYKRQQRVDIYHNKEHLLENLAMKKRVRNFRMTIFYILGITVVVPLCAFTYGWSSIVVFIIIFVIYRGSVYGLPGNVYLVRRKANEYLKERYKIDMKVVQIERIPLLSKIIKSEYIINVQDGEGNMFIVDIEDGEVSDTYFLSYWEDEIEYELNEYIKDLNLIKDTENEISIMLNMNKSSSLFMDYKTKIPSYNVVLKI